MNNKLNNNLFSYATSELSQDAFICYLCSFALDEVEKKKKDPSLSECARKLIDTFSGHEFKDMDFTLNSIRKQVDHIDVLLNITYHGETYEIIIEDKIHSSEHDDQLNRYRDSRINFLKKQGIEKYKVLGVYFKTGFQGEFQPIKEANYIIIGRRELLDILKPYLDRTKNSIIQEYYEYWNQYEEISKEYTSLNIADWHINHILGYYSTLQAELKKTLGINIGYSYAANPRGGEWVLYTQAKDIPVLLIDGHRFGIYIQICFKDCEINTSPSDRKTKAHIFIKLGHLDIEDKKTMVASNKEMKYTKSDVKKYLEDAAFARNQIIYPRGIYRFAAQESHYIKPPRINPGIYMSIGEYSGNSQMHHDLTCAFIDAYKQYLLIVEELCKEFDSCKG